MFGFKKKKRKLKSGVIDKTKSYMMVVPKKQEYIIGIIPSSIKDTC